MKTEQTRNLESAILRYCRHNKILACPEVCIGFGGSEVLDILGYSYNGDWRAFEIKTSVKDFHSKNSVSFCANFNYYCLTDEVYQKVVGEIPRDIGIYVNDTLTRKARRRSLVHRESILYESLIRSLSREAWKLWDSDNPEVIMKLNSEIRRQREGIRDLNKRDRDHQMNVYNYFKSRDMLEEFRKAWRGLDVD